jgi:arabinofuranan 3-O-arabinosyltransferase
MATTLPALRISQPVTSRPGRKRRGIPRDRWLFLISFMIALTIFGATDYGRIVYDTKLGVDINAAEFLARLWSLWNPLEWFGSLQNQYIGYAIPMAPFFLIGQLLHVPIWLVERLWLSLLIAVGFVGMVKLARALNIGSDSSQLLAGVIFVLWPTFTIAIGSTSAAALPGLVVPWSLLPLIAAVAGRSPIWRSAACSGLAVTAMAGVNAVSTLAVLVLPALYILTHTRGRQRARLGLAWCIAVVAATAWWVIPLLLQGKYSFNFLPYIEQATTTSGTMSATAVLRGTGTWTAYLNLGGTPWISAGWALVSSWGAILATSALSAAGLAGLARRDMPERRWLCICVGVAAVAAMAGYYGAFSDPFHGGVDSLLNAGLAPFRSTYKIEPVIAVALALGCAHMMQQLWNVSLPLGRSTRLAASALTAPVVALVLAGLALPQLTGQALQPGSFTSVPSYWYQATAFLARHSPTETALVVPADPHGQFTWGDTIDDPLESLATSPWVERGLVPYGGAGSQVLLETAEQAVESGAQVPGLPAYLSRAGIRFVVVRNDVNPTISGYTAPQVVNETLVQSGFHQVASFGPPVPAAAGYPNLSGQEPGFATSYPSIQIFAADDSGLEPDSPVAALPVSKTVLVNGGPDSLLQLAEQGILGDQPTVIAGQDLPARPALWAVTDGQRRADNDFGSTDSYVSYTYTASGTNPVDDPLGDPGGQPRQLLPVAAAGHQTVAVLSGAASVTASSAGTWLGESTQYDPVNAFDGNPSTAWAEANPDTPVGQWIQITFDHPIDLPARAGIELLDDSSTREIPYQLTASTTDGRAITNTVTTGAEQPLQLPPGPTRWLRITITGASNVVPGNPGAGITDVLIPGVRVTSYLQPAQDPAGATAPAMAFSFSQPAASAAQGSTGISADLNRLFDLPTASLLRANISAVPQPGPALDALISRLVPATKSEFRVSVSSTWDDLPEFSAYHLFGKTPGMPWLAASGDSNPTLEISWHGLRTIRRLDLQSAFGISAAPAGVLIGSPDGDRLETVDLAGLVRVSPPLRTDRLYLSFGSRSANSAGDTQQGQPSQLPIGLARVSIPGLAGLREAVPDDTASFRLSCGQGPSVSVDGHRYQTSVTGTLGELIQLQPVQLQLCTAGGALALPAGQQQLTAAPSSDFDITSLSLVSPTAAASATATNGDAGTRAVHVISWQADSRTVTIGPGPASYLEVHENANPGWSATLDGRALKPLTLDGWQQAFLVPAGQGGTITLAYTPATVYHVGIIVSAVALLVLAGVAVGPGWRIRRRRKRAAARGPGPSQFGFPPAGGPVLIFKPRQDVPSPPNAQSTPAAPAAQPASAAAPAPRAQPAPSAHRVPTMRSPTAAHGRHRATPAPTKGWQVARITAARAFRALTIGPVRTGRTAPGQTARRLAILLPLAIVIFLVGGPVVVAVPALAIIGSWRGRWLPVIAAAAMFAAGVISAASPTPTILGAGPFSGPAQICALIALGAALMPAAFARSDTPAAKDGQP